jgi:hypothetical protein
MRCSKTAAPRCVSPRLQHAESLVPIGDQAFSLSLLQRLRYNFAVICIRVFGFPFWEEGHER